MSWKDKIPWDSFKWAKYAAVDKDGHMHLYRDEPLCDVAKGFWWESIFDVNNQVEADIPGTVKNFGNWEKSLTQKPGTEKSEKKMQSASNKNTSRRRKE